MCDSLIQYAMIMCWLCMHYIGGSPVKLGILISPCPLHMLLSQAFFISPFFVATDFHRAEKLRKYDNQVAFHPAGSAGFLLHALAVQSCG